MSNWRETILKNFIPNVSKLTLVADPDGLLTEERLSLELRDRGFDLIEYSDAIEFRYAYESRYRSIWDQGIHTDLVVILRLQDTELLSLPYDLIQAGRKLFFNLGDLFENLSYPVLEKLDRSLLDLLFEACHKYPVERMGDNGTKDFILKHVYGIGTELILNDVDLLKTLLRLHYSQINMPEFFSDRLVDILSKHSKFQDWDLNKIVPDANSFFAFLQERWPIFIQHLSRTGNLSNVGGLSKAGASKKAEPIKEDSSEYNLNEHVAYNLQYHGPTLIPFDHQDIRVYIDNLFTEEKMMPVQYGRDSNGAIDPKSWVCIGIREKECHDNQNNTEKFISKRFDLIQNSFPTAEFRYSDWINFALKWAQLSSMVHLADNNTLNSQLLKMSQKINGIFTVWLIKNYYSLINLPPTNPVMLHHIPRRMARYLEESKKRSIALIVVDGLALDQWFSIKRILQEHENHLIMKESGVFAWIPTLTSVSRQSIFSGKTPNYFPSSIKSTNSEGKLWNQFWESNGLTRFEIAYQRGLSDGNVEHIMDEVIHPGKTKVVGLVVDKVDKIMHGMQLGSAGMHNQIEQWCRKGFFISLITYLLDSGYDVWMTSDHGNIECEGKGRPSEGVIAETRGERVRVYPTAELRNQVADKFSFAHEWNPIGLPPEYFPLVTGGREAFIHHGNTIVGHGGISIEEVIVPLVNFKRGAR